MNFGFDIDGTISAAPDIFATIMRSLIAAGHGVHVLSGTGDTVITDHYDRRREQLAAWGIPYTALKIVCNPHHLQAKADYCREHDIVMMFEDSVPYTRSIMGNGVTNVVVMGETVLSGRMT